MNIKSDKNNHSIRKFFNKWILSEDAYNPFSIRLGILLICSGIGYQLWDYSGLFSALSYSIGSVFFFFKDNNLIEKLFKILFVSVILFWISTVDAYYQKKRTINVEYDKIEFIDATQKMVVYATKPLKEPLVFTFAKDKTYFSLKNDNNITFNITEYTINDHYDKLFDPNHIKKWEYKLTYKSNTISSTIKEWRVNKKQLYKDVK